MYTLNSKFTTKIKQRVMVNKPKELKWDNTIIQLIQKKAGKEKRRNKERMGHIENKPQYHKFKTNCTSN